MPKLLGAFAAGAALAGTMLGVGGTASATTFGFDVTGGCSEACAANTQITPGTGMLTVVLNDTEANPHSAGDLLSSIEITTSSGAGTPSLTLQAGTLITVASNTGPYTTSPGPPTHWGVGVSGGQIVLETAGPFAVGGEPINMIIGPPDAGGNYSNGNSSVVDGHFSPYIDGTGTFTISDASITANTTITGVSFDFGTGPDTTLPGVPFSAIPEPGTLALFGTALAGLGAWRRRRRSVL